MFCAREVSFEDVLWLGQVMEQQFPCWTSQESSGYGITLFSLPGTGRSIFILDFCLYKSKTTCNHPSFACLDPSDINKCKENCFSPFRRICAVGISCFCFFSFSSSIEQEGKCCKIMDCKQPRIFLAGFLSFNIDSFVLHWNNSRHKSWVRSGCLTGPCSGSGET